MKLWGRRQEWRHKIKDGEKKQAVEKCSEHRRGEVKRKEEAKEYKKQEKRREEAEENRTGEKRRSKRIQETREQKKQKKIGRERREEAKECRKRKI